MTICTPLFSVFKTTSGVCSLWAPQTVSRGTLRWWGSCTCNAWGRIKAAFVQPGEEKVKDEGNPTANLRYLISSNKDDSQIYFFQTPTGNRWEAINCSSGNSDWSKTKPHEGGASTGMADQNSCRISILGDLQNSNGQGLNNWI